MCLHYPTIQPQICTNSQYETPHRSWMFPSKAIWQGSLIRIRLPLPNLFFVSEEKSKQLLFNALFGLLTPVTGAALCLWLPTYGGISPSRNRNCFNKTMG
jgi:hypothetical protein